MKNFKYFLSVLLIISSGCTTSNNSSLVKNSLPAKQVVSAESSKQTALPVKKIRMGKIFAKADFEGVVKTSYVKLDIVDKTNPQKTYEIFIGDKAQQWDFPWKAQTVNPDYFVLNLPAGSYSFQKISIPVGSTLASEPMNISFDVLENRINYLGTLKVTGVGEKIHLGGVPLMKPGFNYRVQVRDDHIEALMELRQRFPEINNEMDIRLMRVVLPANFAMHVKG